MAHIRFWRALKNIKATGRNCAKATHILLTRKKASNMFPLIEKAIYVFTDMSSLLQQLKKRRLALGLKQNDMMLRVGVSRQQYQRLESKGNPRLDTLELIAKGLNTELMLIPKEKLSAVMAVLEQEPLAISASSEDSADSAQKSLRSAKEDAKKSLSDDPWQDLLGDD